MRMSEAMTDKTYQPAGEWTCYANAEAQRIREQFPTSVLQLGLALHSPWWVLHSWRLVPESGVLVEATSIPDYYFGVDSSPDLIDHWLKALGGVK